MTEVPTEADLSIDVRETLAYCERLVREAAALPEYMRDMATPWAAQCVGLCRRLLVAEAKAVLAEEEAERLRQAIRTHRDQRWDDRCWLDDAALYNALSETALVDTSLPPREEFLKSCDRFWRQRQSPGDEANAPKCMTLAQLEADNARLRSIAEEAKLRAGYIVGMCQGEKEMRAEAVAILKTIDQDAEGKVSG